MLKSIERDRFRTFGACTSSCATKTQLKMSVTSEIVIMEERISLPDITRIMSYENKNEGTNLKTEHTKQDTKYRSEVKNED